MLKLSRVLLASSVAGSLAVTLAACGGSDDKDAAAQAHTTACRSYLVGGGAGDEALAATLVKIVRGFSDPQGADYEPSALKSGLLEVRTGAAEAGRTENLSENDFKLFAQLAGAATQVLRQLEPAASDEGLDESSPAPLTDAVEAVHKLCH